MTTIIVVAVEGLILSIFIGRYMRIPDESSDRIQSEGGLLESILAPLLMLLLKGCLFAIIAVPWMFFHCIQNIFFLVKMKKLMQEDILVAEDDNRKAQQYIHTYFEMVDITRTLNLVEPRR